MYLDKVIIELPEKPYDSVTYVDYIFVAHLLILILSKNSKYQYTLVIRLINAQNNIHEVRLYPNFS